MGEESKWRRFVIGRNPKWTLIRAASLLVLSFVIFKLMLVPVRVMGISMAPAYRDGKINFANRLVYRLREPRRGEVVVIQTTGTSITYIKRIVGLPGDRVAITNNVLYVNGAPVTEPYVTRSIRRKWNHPEVVLEPDEYFVIGDNRRMDQKLHEYGRVERWRIYGKILF